MLGGIHLVSCNALQQRMDCLEEISQGQGIDMRRMFQQSMIYVRAAESPQI